MIFFVAAVVCIGFSFVMSYYEYHNAYFFANELQLLFTAAAAYFVCPMSQWRMKLISSIYLMFTIALFIHNYLLIYSVLPEGVAAAFSFLGIFLICSAFGTTLLVRWDHLPTYIIQKGYMYEIIGKPRTNLQMLGFFLYFGKGGYFALTNGVHTWKFSKKTERLEECDFNENHITGKNVVEIGHYREKVRQRVGTKWSLINNCHTLKRWA